MSTDNSGGVTNSTPPPSIQGYRVEPMPIGRGAYGAVFRGTRQQDDLAVAIKLLAPTTNDPNAKTRFLQEAVIIKNLSHTLIPKLIDYQFSDECSYIITEYTPGDSLATHLVDPCRKPVVTRPDVAVEICGCVADSIAHAHKRGLLHRDLKPGNIILNPIGEPSVVDWGLAAFRQSSHELSGSQVVVGTDGYTAPELYIRGSTATERSDIYSLGAVLYQLLTGCESADLKDLYSSDDNDPRSYRDYEEEIPEGIAAVCKKCLSKEPTDRYQTMGEVREALLASLGTDDPAPRPWPVGSSRIMRVLVHLLVLGVIALAGYTAILHHEVKSLSDHGARLTSLETALNESRSAPRSRILIAESIPGKPGVIGFTPWSGKDGSGKEVLDTDPDVWHTVTGFNGSGYSFNLPQSGSLFVVLHLGEVQWKGNTKSTCQISLRLVVDDKQVAKTYREFSTPIEGTGTLGASGAQEMSIVWGANEMNAGPHTIKVEWRVHGEGVGHVYLAEANATRTLLVTYFPRAGAL